jgi:hypothetical protein
VAKNHKADCIFIEMKNFLLPLLILLIYSCNENAKENIPVKQPDTLQPNSNTDTKNISGNDLSSKLSYLIIEERKDFPLQNDSLKKIIDQHPEKNIDSLVDFILEMTTNQLTFTFEKCDSDPRLLVKSKKANCVGYAAFYISLMNYALQKNGFSKEYECHHFVGKIFYDGANVNALFGKDPFFKDHDFNLIYKLDQSEKIAVDPSLYAYLGIRRIAIRDIKNSVLPKNFATKPQSHQGKVQEKQLCALVPSWQKSFTEIFSRKAKTPLFRLIFNNYPIVFQQVAYFIAPQV